MRFALTATRSRCATRSASCSTTHARPRSCGRPGSPTADGADGALAQLAELGLLGAACPRTRRARPGRDRPGAGPRRGRATPPCRCRWPRPRSSRRRCWPRRRRPGSPRWSPATCVARRRAAAGSIPVRPAAPTCVLHARRRACALRRPRRPRRRVHGGRSRRPRPLSGAGRRRPHRRPGARRAAAARAALGHRRPTVGLGRRMLDLTVALRPAAGSSSACRSAASRRSSTSSPTPTSACEFARPGGPAPPPGRWREGAGRAGPHVDGAVVLAAEAGARREPRPRSSATAPSATPSSTTCTCYAKRAWALAATSRSAAHRLRRARRRRSACRTREQSHDRAPRTRSSAYRTEGPVAVVTMQPAASTATPRTPR